MTDWRLQGENKNPKEGKIEELVSEIQRRLLRKEMKRELG